MKKVICIILIFLFMVGCSANKVEQSNESSIDQNEINHEVVNEELSPSVEEGADASEDKESSVETTPEEEGNNEQEEVEMAGYKGYRPNVGDIRTFAEEDFDIYTEEIIAENDRYVQMLVTLGGNQTVEIYKWTEDEIALVYEEFNPENIRGNLLENFNESNVIETIVSHDREADWELIKEHKTFQLNGKEYTDVFVVKKETEEYVGETSTYIRYYALDKGMIKETVEVTGENGYTSEIYLKE